MNENNVAKDWNGTGKQKCTKCGAVSIAGMIKGKGLCRYHWCEFVWGKNWADKCFPNYHTIGGTHDQL